MHNYINQQLETLHWNIAPRELYLPIGYALESGGKRIRPTLVLMACELFGGTKAEAKNAALAIEVFHNFTLLHDDIMDNAETRRNRLTVHKKWNANTAILSGDAMMIKAYELLENTPTHLWSKIFPLFTRTALEVCEGQQYDMNFETDENVTLDDYFNMIRLKTAVLLGAALKLGAIVGGASEKDAQHLYDYGIAIGIAFQLKDDYLDSFGDEKSFGKRIGGDILCGKKTFLLINALTKATKDDRILIHNTLANCEISEEQKIETIKAIYKKLEIPRLCEEAISNYYNRALQALDKITDHKNDKKPFIALAEQLMQRVD
ncbi:MAG TPA: polyprenyl synthetase family protein [Paludibacteraceae bacterium]|nr:polyprenyl synthetase family protein [Paludibacteraceae bacterium]HQB68830.1 polyprenyl synthetase family protein [Paludibacteraceae bacterium]HRS67493.1 polyprenyl synthetase family protein [Paludibacteraceae bacterium]